MSNNQIAAAEKKKKNPIAIAWSVITWTLVGLVVLLAIALVGIRFVGFTPYSILSPSMTPKYQVGDLIYVQKADFEDIKVGDPITYVANKSLKIVTHRVVEIDPVEQKFRTKGDANDQWDAAPVLYENVVGVVKFSLPKLGYISNYISTDSGRYIAICVVLGLFVLMIIPELLKPEPKKNEKGSAEAPAPAPVPAEPKAEAEPAPEEPKEE